MEIENNIPNDLFESLNKMSEYSQDNSHSIIIYN